MLKAFSVRLAFFVIILIQGSCRNTSNEISPDLPNILVTQDRKLAVLDVFEEPLIIELEQCDNCLIGDINKVVKDDSGFYILDKDRSEAIFKFDLNGNFLFKIDAKGEGPGQYRGLFDFDLLEDEVELFILDMNSRKFLVFDKNDGSFLRELPYSTYQIESFFALSSDLFAVEVDGRDASIEKVDLGHIVNFASSDTIFSGVKDYPKTVVMFYGQEFTRSKYSFLFSRALNDTIYSLGEKEFKPKYVLDFDDRRVSDDLKSLDIMEMGQGIQKEAPFFSLGRNFENSKFLIFNWFSGKEFDQNGFYNKEENEFYNLNTNKTLFRNPFYMDEESVFTFYSSVDQKYSPLPEYYSERENFYLAHFIFKK